jgi:hypothetical protein
MLQPRGLVFFSKNLRPISPHVMALLAWMIRSLPTAKSIIA